MNSYLYFVGGERTVITQISHPVLVRVDLIGVVYLWTVVHLIQKSYKKYITVLINT